MVQQQLFDSNPPQQPRRYPGMPRTDFANFLTETDKFIQSHPDIIELIEEDLDAQARAKKKLRIKDRNWEIQQKRKEEEEQEEEIETEPINEDQLVLHEGRPRTSGYVVLVALCCSGYHCRGTMSRSFNDLLYESKSIECLLNRRGEDLPAPKTLWELIDAISNDTRYQMFKAQIEEIVSQGLEDFSTMILDSTHVEANSAWPTDGGIILKLIERIWRNGNKLEEFGFENFQRHWTETWIEKINKAVFKINTTDHKSIRKKQYKRIYHFAENAYQHLEEERKEFEGKVRPKQIKPSRREQLERLRDQIRQDLSDLKEVLDYSQKRVLEGISTSSTQKVLSVGGDEDAAYIKKGGREAVIGYRPQIGRSKNGFAGTFYLPEGNPNDAPLLDGMVAEWERATGIVPEQVSTDGGYASEDGVEDVEDRGVELVSISGGKGKKILGEDTYGREVYGKARRKRSAVESTISVVKGVYGFGRASRRGIKSVRGELLEDVIAHNFVRMGQVRRERKQREEKEPEVA
jgi:hypothetical protein